MKQKIFSVLDRAVGKYMSPWASPSSPAATRAFKDVVNDPQTPMNKHPEDYDLYEIGEFDDDEGTIKGKIPMLVIRAQDIQGV